MCTRALCFEIAQLSIVWPFSYLCLPPKRGGVIHKISSEKGNTKKQWEPQSSELVNNATLLQESRNN